MLQRNLQNLPKQKSEDGKEKITLKCSKRLNLAVTGARKERLREGFHQPPTTNQRGTERERERVREREREKGREGIHTRHVLPRVKDSRLKRSYFASSSGTSNDQYYDNSSRPQSVAGRFISRHLGHPLSSLRPAVSTPSFQPLVRPLATSRCTSREYGQPYLRVRAWLSGCPG